ncbi:type II toxin-antitoxin system Phd/YefM family antitoxin [Candidatus Roizmanbacteria bacterium]|nr:type II toxin-antitoxin system Phd/YefM family antitoxin [Candidatus Roizmanbacteria bacterium]
MNIIAISQFRNNLPRFIDEVGNYMKRFVISVSGKPKAVVLSLEELESLEETAEILAIPGAKESIKRGLKQAKKRQGIALNKLLK